MSKIIVWVDSDPNIESSATFLKDKGFDVVCFNETLDAVGYVRKMKENVWCIITSMMERGGRKERGLMNAFEMIDQIRVNWTFSYAPFLVMITTSADEQACKDNGFDVIVYYDRTKMQKIVSEQLLKNSGAYYHKKKNNILWREPNLLPCQNLKENALIFLRSLNIPDGLMDHFADRCFCVNCEPKVIWYRGNPKEKYVLPIGWYRFGIKIREEYLDKKINIYDWNVGYHGTAVENVYSIIDEHRIMFPGDRLKNGKILGIKHNDCFANDFNGPVIYVSPSIKYASHSLYAPPYDFDGKKVRVVFQCRIKPGSFKKYKETLCYGNKIIDENFKNSEIEWITDDRTAVVPYGLLIGFFNN